MERLESGSLLPCIRNSKLLHSIPLHTISASGQGLKSGNDVLRHSRYSIPDSGFTKDPKGLEDL